MLPSRETERNKAEYGGRPANIASVPGSSHTCSPLDVPFMWVKKKTTTPFACLTGFCHSQLKELWLVQSANQTSFPLWKQGKEGAQQTWTGWVCSSLLTHSLQPWPKIRPLCGPRFHPLWNGLLWAGNKVTYVCPHCCKNGCRQLTDVIKPENRKRNGQWNCTRGKECELQGEAQVPGCLLGALDHC